MNYSGTDNILDASQMNEWINQQVSHETVNMKYNLYKKHSVNRN